MSKTLKAMKRPGMGGSKKSKRLGPKNKSKKYLAKRTRPKRKTMRKAGLSKGGYGNFDNDGSFKDTTMSIGNKISSGIAAIPLPGMKEASQIVDKTFKYAYDPAEKAATYYAYNTKQGIKNRKKSANKLFDKAQKILGKDLLKSKFMN